ncbi:MAG: disulfide bond formation protein B [Rhizobiaceae bacterium]
MSGKRLRYHSIGAALVLVGMVLAVGTALGFEHIGGYIPCKLCLEQRIPYYIGIPLMAVTLGAAWLNAPGILVRLLLVAGGALMVWGLVLGVYHSGVEWHWWAGPADCGAVAGAPETGGAGVLDMLDKVIPPSCDEAAGRFLGLSFAGWNVIASIGLAAIAFRAAMSRE